jgi:hypothetical protein
MPDTIQLQERCRAGLMTLYQNKEAARTQADVAGAVYNAALNSAIAALGLDPQDNHSLDLDTGVLTPAEKPKEAP